MCDNRTRFRAFSLASLRSPVCLLDVVCWLIPYTPVALPSQGCTTLLVDEDTCATNFMIRDMRMQMWVLHVSFMVQASAV